MVPLVRACLTGCVVAASFVPFGGSDDAWCEAREDPAVGPVCVGVEDLHVGGDDTEPVGECVCA